MSLIESEQIMANKEFRSNGKLLITGEYVVLDGALSFALPTKFGQSLEVTETTGGTIQWQALNYLDKEWFSAELKLSAVANTSEEGLLKSSDYKIAETLLSFLREAKKLNGKFLENLSGVSITTKLEFPENWGLGSSSTLINNIANWANVDAFQLLWNSFSGSGYDIACARNNSGITYQLKDKKPFVNLVDFNFDFKEKLFFVHLNKKQNSREGINHYKEVADAEEKKVAISKISTITQKLLTANNLNAFEALLNEHEEIISQLLKQETIKDIHFSDFDGSIKSLGAWGGDFVLVTGSRDYVVDYFNTKGHKTILSYTEMIK
ncbi:GYDIA family GHMP kinase [Galbibacter mesophilus]|uniref:GYDIA family GHMP kinase n=1 Tax=Galbibacter mesophilus TaxID=379069 RepID=UPI001F5DD816|nr:GYDIA family GHMP kinase [Galbibacter mesophilus]MCM5662632.1 GYDIA family GHMP kinase [Galbibacter mesophilus]